MRSHRRDCFLRVVLHVPSVDNLVWSDWTCILTCGIPACTLAPSHDHFCCYHSLKTCRYKLWSTSCSRPPLPLVLDLALSFVGFRRWPWLTSFVLLLCLISTLRCLNPSWGRRLNEAAFNGLRPVVASVMLRTPIVGHILKLVGAVSASPAAIDDALRKGHSLGIVSNYKVVLQSTLNLHLQVLLLMNAAV